MSEPLRGLLMSVNDIQGESQLCWIGLINYRFRVGGYGFYDAV